MLGTLKHRLKSFLRPAVEQHAQEDTSVDANLSGWFDQEGGALFKGFTVGPQDSVLDIGCGDGTFIRFCAQLGAEVLLPMLMAPRSLMSSAPCRAPLHVAFRAW